MKLMNSDTHSWTHSLASFAIYNEGLIQKTCIMITITGLWSAFEKHTYLLKMVAYLACLWN